MNAQPPKVAAVRFSVVVPFLDERESLEELYIKLLAVFEPLGSFELIFVDDGSTDGSFEVVRRLFERDRRVGAVQLRKNFGKSAALTEGFQRARGEIIVTIDADLQDDPTEIPKLVEGLERADIVTGWKRQRHDPWTKTFPSRIFNRMTRSVFGVKLHDLNSGLKVMRREVADAIDLYGELHRFIPVLAALQGFRVEELPVTHHERKFGRSKYGWKRFVRGGLDLLTVGFLGRFQHRPLHLFGAIGAMFFVVGVILGIYLSVLRFQGQSIGQRPLLTLSVLAIITGFQFLFTGLLAELITARSSRHYPVRTVLKHDDGTSRR